MKSYSKFTAGLLIGFACVRYAQDKVVLHLSNLFWNQIPLRRLRSATAATRQINQQLPHSRLGELTRCCAPVFHGVVVTQSSSLCHKAVTEMSLFCRSDVTLIREDAVVVYKLEILPAGAGAVT
jgi:hypothetical protein